MAGRSAARAVVIRVSREVSGGGGEERKEAPVFCCVFDNPPLTRGEISDAWSQTGPRVSTQYAVYWTASKKV